MTEIKGSTRILGIIGWPIEHSLSPLMQNRAIAACGQDLVFVPFPVHPNALAAAVTGLRSLGVAGFNVTIPHKNAIIPLLDEVTPEARMMGAVNTVQCDGSRLVGHNTDGPGLLRALTEEFGFNPAGRRVLLIGAGGAARAALVSLARAGAVVTVANRTEEKGTELVNACRQGVAGAELAVSSLDILGAPELSRFDLIVNSTSVGMWGTAFTELDAGCLQPTTMVYDMVYAPLETPLLKTARERGAPAANGLSMLAAQGELAFAIWTGAPPPAGLMRETLLTAVTESD